jgi:hypothetical protein
VQGIVEGEPRIVVEHVTRIHPSCAPDWPTPPGGHQGAHRAIIEGRPRIEVTENEIFTNPAPWPTDPTLEHYSSGWTASNTSFGVFFRNSLIVTVGAVIGNVPACSLAAYAFARLSFPLKKLWFTLMLGTIMLPFHATLIPPVRPVLQPRLDQHLSAAHRAEVPGGRRVLHLPDGAVHPRHSPCPSWRWCRPRCSSFLPEAAGGGPGDERPQVGAA